MIPWIWLVEGAKTIRGYIESFSPMGFSLSKKLQNMK